MLRRLLTRLSLHADTPATAPTGAVPTSGLPDRPRLQRWLRAARRRGHPGTIAALVLDGHDTVRAMHGAAAADAVREAAARRLQALDPGVRLAQDGADAPARFLLWWPGVDAAEARDRLQRDSEALGQPMATGHGLIGGLRWSAGLSTCQHPASHRGPTAASSLAAAEAALQAARARGPGQMVLAGDELRQPGRADAAGRVRRRGTPPDAWAPLPAWPPASAPRFDADGGALAWIDADHFGAYNDHHGTPAGEAALRQIAEALQSLPRPPAALCRAGGASLVAVLPRVPRARWHAAGDALRAAVEGLALPHDQSPTAPVLTVTVGIVGIVGGTAPASLDALYAAARDAARLGRDRGERNQVHVTTVRVGSAAPPSASASASASAPASSPPMPSSVRARR